MNYLEQLEQCEDAESLYFLGKEMSRQLMNKIYLITMHYHNRSEMFVVKDTNESNALIQIISSEKRYDCDKPEKSYEIEELDLSEPNFIMELRRSHEKG